MYHVASIPHFTNGIAAAAYSIIAGLGEQTFVVYFTKRTTGETRRMVCYYRQPMFTTRSWDPAQRQLLNVWDVEAGAFRFISMDAVDRIVAGGKTYRPGIDRPAPSPVADPYDIDLLYN